MNNLKDKVQFNGTELDFLKSLFKMQILIDLLSKELNSNYPKLNSNYKKQLTGITKSFEKFKINVNSGSNWNYDHLNDGQKYAIFELSEEVEKILNKVINDVYDN